jgi:pre-mRNA-processing factor 17
LLAIPTLAIKDDMLALQTFDDAIMTYQLTPNKFVRQRRTLTGHETLGYACQPSFSPDTRFLASGDGRGRVWVWDWNSGNVVRKLEGHDKVVVCVAWHPQDTNALVSCSWDSTIKLWQ